MLGRDRNNEFTAAAAFQTGNFQGLGAFGSLAASTKAAKEDNPYAAAAGAFKAMETLGLDVAAKAAREAMVSSSFSPVTVAAFQALRTYIPHLAQGVSWSFEGVSWSFVRRRRS